jgi:hypothetical protein
MYLVLGQVVPQLANPQPKSEPGIGNISLKAIFSSKNWSPSWFMQKLFSLLQQSRMIAVVFKEVCSGVRSTLHLLDIKPNAISIRIRN